MITSVHILVLKFATTRKNDIQYVIMLSIILQCSPAGYMPNYCRTPEEEKSAADACALINTLLHPCHTAVRQLNIKIFIKDGRQLNPTALSNFENKQDLTK